MFFLTVILILMYKHKGVSTSARYYQYSTIVAKLLFFTSLCLGSALKINVIACKMVSLLFHFSLIVSLMNMIAFGVKVSSLMSKLNHNMANLTVENQRLFLKGLDIIVLVSLWSGSFIIIILSWLYDYLNSKLFFSFGLNGICKATSNIGILYLIVIPGIVSIIINLLCLIFSIFHYNTILSGGLKKDISVKLISFIIKLVVVQSLQWIFGIAYYFFKKSNPRLHV